MNAFGHLAMLCSLSDVGSGVQTIDVVFYPCMSTVDDWLLAVHGLAANTTSYRSDGNASAAVAAGSIVTGQRVCANVRAVDFAGNAAAASTAGVVFDATAAAAGIVSFGVPSGVGASAQLLWNTSVGVNASYSGVAPVAVEGFVWLGWTLLACTSRSAVAAANDALAFVLTLSNASVIGTVPSGVAGSSSSPCWSITPVRSLSVNVTHGVLGNATVALPNACFLVIAIVGVEGGCPNRALAPTLSAAVGHTTLAPDVTRLALQIGRESHVVVNATTRTAVTYVDGRGVAAVPAFVTGAVDSHGSFVGVAQYYWTVVSVSGTAALPTAVNGSWRVSKGVFLGQVAVSQTSPTLQYRMGVAVMNHVGRLSAIVWSPTFQVVSRHRCYLLASHWHRCGIQRDKRPRDVHVERWHAV